MTALAVESISSPLTGASILEKLNLARIALLQAAEHHESVATGAPTPEQYARAHPQTDLRITMEALQLVTKS